MVGLITTLPRLKGGVVLFNDLSPKKNSQSRNNHL